MFIINNLSDKMFQMNRELKFFGELLVELKNYSGIVIDRRDGQKNKNILSCLFIGNLNVFLVLKIKGVNGFYD